MIVLALLCLLVAAALILFMLFVDPNQSLSYSFFAGDFSTRPLWVFVAGAVTLLLIVLAVDFFRRGTRRTVARRREIRQLREQSAAAPVATGYASGGQGGGHGGGASAGHTGGQTEETYVRETRDGRTEPTDRA